MHAGQSRITSYNVCYTKLLRIGLLPSANHEIVASIGNAAGAGACMVLLSEKAREETGAIAASTEHVNLAGHPKFEHCYAQGMYFPK